jgi:hypothetical protein
MNPMKQISNLDERLWSEWDDSVRKDVEYCFGILKKAVFVSFALVCYCNHKEQ